jgi:hypothetical protein
LNKKASLYNGLAFSFLENNSIFKVKIVRVRIALRGLKLPFYKDAMKVTYDSEIDVLRIFQQRPHRREL